VGYPSRVSGKGKAGPLEAGRGKYSPPANPERVTLEALSERTRVFSAMKEYVHGLLPISLERETIQCCGAAVKLGKILNPKH